MGLANLLIAAVALAFGGLGSAPAEERAPSLRVGISAGGAPMAFFDQGVLRGLEVDLARLLADAMNRQLQLHEMPRTRLVDGLRGGRIDLILSTLPQRDLDALGLIASEPLLRTGQMVLIRARDAATFARPLDVVTTRGRVGYQRGSAGARFVHANLPEAERVPVTDAVWGVAALRAGDIDLFVHEATTIWAVATDPRETELLGVFRPLTDEHLAWVMRAEDAPLRRNVNLWIRASRQARELAGLVNHWIPVQVEVGN